MKFKNQKNIINDSDINMTGQYLNKTLDTVLHDQEQDISELKRNVKFLYQYGGVGSKSGGGGSGDSSDYSIYATLNNVVISQDNLISLNGDGNYNLQIAINRPGGLEYSITYTYWNKSSPAEGTTVKTVLNMSNQYMYSTYIQLNMNGTIRIDSFTILQSGDSLRKQVIGNYITSPYSFETYLGNNNGNRFNVRDNELFINTASDQGLFAYINYDIGIQGTASYTYNKLNANKLIEFEEETDIDLSETSRGIIKLPITPDGFLIDENAGYYTINIKISVTPVGQNKIVINKVINLNLIPNSLYLKVSPNNKDASLYDNNIVENPYTFGIGSIMFDLKIYEGYSSSGKTQYEITPSITKLGNTSEQNITVTFSTIYANERESFTTKNLSVSYSGWNKVQFDVYSTYSGRSITVEKYFYVKENYALDWEYFSGANDNNNLHYGINNGSFGTTEFINIFNKDKLLIQSESIDQKVLEIVDSRMDSFSVGETLINIGIQYNSINNINTPILEIASGNSSITNLDIKIYQNKVSIGPELSGGSTGQKVEIFLPKEDLLDSSNNDKYHLLTLYRKYYTTIEGEPRYEFLVYLDGILEGALPTLGKFSILFKKITFYRTGFIINLFDIMYFPEKTSSIFKDSDISRFWYTYNQYYSTTRYSENQLNFLVNLSNLASNFKLNSLCNSKNTKMVEVNQDTLASLVKTPGLSSVVLFDVVDDVEFDDISARYDNNFLVWYQKTQDSKDKTDTGKKYVSVSFKGENETDFTSISDNSNKYRFYIEKQGTSTLENFSKNLNLGIESNITNEDCLFSPNFEEITISDRDDEKIRKYGTFLPEQVFTLKKDVVDSAHSNNNSIADFVNKNTTKFKTGEEGKYSPYIKNCLTGFPCLVFVRTKYTPKSSTLSDSHITTYYLGYYNFNLGRESYYNLGYYNTLNLSGVKNITDNTIGLTNGFKVYSIDRNINKIKDGVMIAEVLDNSSYYDFSQYDPTILFGYNQNDAYHMLGKFKTSSNDEILQEKLINFVKNISLSGGFIFEYLQKNFGNQTDEYNKTIELTKIDEQTGNEISYLSSYNQVPNYRIQYEKRFDGENYNPVQKSGQFDEGTWYILQKVLNGETEQEEDIPPLVDYISLVQYYVILMAFGMTDSIQKNLNIKSWNEGKTFNLAFYDMDTALGVDNGGNEINYFAFSDYYDIPTDESVSQAQYLLKKAIVYRDFAIKGQKSYDVPSSYLFAIAKYAKLILGNSLSSDLFPLQYWANLRSNELLNADTFMNKYYKNRKSNIGEALINYDYRATYFIENRVNDSINYQTHEFSQFHGQRSNKVRDWLNDRLHILDVYMGLISVSDSNRYIEYLDQNNQWRAIIKNGVPMKELEALHKPTSNDDVIIFKDIFSESGGNSYSNNISAVIKALENSFTVINSPNTPPQYYLIKDPNKKYNLDIKVSGTQNISIGGSDRWYYIDNLAPFAREVSTEETRLYIDSNHLQEFNISGNKKITSLVQANLRAVRNVNISGINNSFTLNIGDDTTAPNVQSVNLQNCKVILNANQSSVTSVSAKGIQSTDLNLQNCNYLTNFEISNLVIEGHSGTSTTVYTDLNKLTINPLRDNFIINDIKIKNINITASGDNRKLNISNNSTLEKLTVRGFTSIYIDSCPNLCEIKISGSSPITDFKVTNCGSAGNVSHLTINSNLEDEYEVDLSNFTITGEVSFQNTKNIYSISLPQCKLSGAAFQATRVTKILGPSNGSIAITGTNTFNDCPITSGLQYLTIDSNCTSLSGTFNASGSGKLSLNEITTFLNNIPSNNNITNINYLFGWQTSFTYNRSSTPAISLSRFTKVTSARGIFCGSSLSYLDKNIFQGLGSDNGGVNIDFADSLNVSSNKLYCTIDSLQHIIGKTQHFNMFIGIHSSDANSIGLNTSRKLVLVKNNKQEYTVDEAKSINILDFFRSGQDQQVQFIDIYNVQFDKAFNYNGFFAKPHDTLVGEYIINWPNLKIIYNCFDKIYSEDNTHVQQNFETLNLKQLPKLQYIFNSFNEIDSPEYLDLNNLINWNKFSQASSDSVVFNSNIIGGFSNTRVNIVSGRLLFNSFRSIKKYINKSNYNSINQILSNSNYYTKFGNIFENTLLISDNADAFIPNNINNKCTQLCDTFSGAKIIKSSAIPDSIYDDAWFTLLQDNDFIALDINNIVSKFPNCTIFNGTFQNITINKALPIDFFKRRKSRKTLIYRINQENNTLLIEDEQYIRANLVEWYYTTNISDLTRCFYKVEIKDSSNLTLPRYFNKDNFQDFNTIPLNHIEDLENPSSILSDTKYKTGPQSSVSYIKENYEITDCNNVIVRYDKSISSNFKLDEVSYENIQLDNNFIDDHADYDNILFVAPDIFYGCTKNCNITECFAECNFVGALPQHLFRPFDKGNPTITNWINKTNILPRYLNQNTMTYQLKTPLVNSLNKRNYIFIPEDFGNISNYNYGFTFNLRLPPQFNIENQDAAVIAYYIFSSTSLTNKLSSLENSLPVYIEPFISGIKDQGNGVLNARRAYFVNPGNIYINIMYNKTTEKDGFGLNKVQVSKLFTGPYCKMGYGYLFVNGTTWNNYSKNQSSNTIMIIGEGVASAAHYLKHIFPPTGSDIAKQITNNGGELTGSNYKTYVLRSLIEGGAENYSIVKIGVVG